GQAKTLMFVQLNPKPDSYSETLSSLKFAERVSGVELGAAHSNKEGKDVRELMEQVASLKDTIAKKDEEIEHLQLLKDSSNAAPSSNSERKASAGGGVAIQRGNTLLGEKGLALPDRSDKAAYLSDQENNDSDHVDFHHSMEAGPNSISKDIANGTGVLIGCTVSGIITKGFFTESVK
ncbi:hypothetical protein MKX01_015838, partial [Papaver californicum]